MIGQGGALPWRLKSDMAHFRAVTLGKPVVMGRKTYQSLSRKPLARPHQYRGQPRPRFRRAWRPGGAELEAALAAARGDALRRCADAIA